MKYLPLFLTLISGIFLTSCNHTPKQNAESTSTSDTTFVSVNDSGEIKIVGEGATPVAEGINPAHGEPGHRCDIPVGAPLNSVPIVGGGTGQMGVPDLSNVPPNPNSK